LMIRAIEIMKSEIIMNAFTELIRRLGSGLEEASTIRQQL
jgi:hypothetical protein